MAISRQDREPMARRPNSFSKFEKHFCPVCGDIVDVDGEWNEDVHNPMHRLCANQPQNDKEEVWSKNTRKVNDNAKMLIRAIRGKWIPEENMEHYLNMLQGQLDTCTHDRTRHRIIDTLLKHGREGEKLELSRRAIDIQRDQFEFNKRRLESNLPTQVVGVATDFENQTNSLLDEIEALGITARVLEDNSGSEADGDPGPDEAGVVGHDRREDVSG